MLAAGSANFTVTRAIRASRIGEAVAGRVLLRYARDAAIPGLLAMRVLLVAMSMAALVPSLVFAQTPSGTARGGDITRDQYIEHAVERARKSAATRFDRLDTNHDGVLTADERRAARSARRNSGTQ
jgi:hypothetical protein